MNTHVQYESPISSDKNVMAKVKVICSSIQRWHQGYGIKFPDIRPGSLKSFYKKSGGGGAGVKHLNFAKVTTF